MRMFDGRGGTHANAQAIKEAEAYAATGGQALHVWDPGPDGWPGAPQVFLQNRPWAHLFDNDVERLKATCKKLGVRVLAVGREGRRGQHIDLCAGPLRKAMGMCEVEAPKMGTIPTIISSNRFAVIDLETTGLAWKGSNRPADQIVQVAVAQIDYGQPRFRISCQLKPTVPITPKAEEIHGLSARHLIYSPEFKDIAKELAVHIGDRCLLGYNILRFDSKFLERQFAEANVPINWDMLDVYVWAKRHGNSFSSNALGVAAARHGVVTKDRHDAFGDVRATWALFVKMARLHPEIGERSLATVLEHQAKLTEKK